VDVIDVMGNLMQLDRGASVQGRIFV